MSNITLKCLKHIGGDLIEKAIQSSILTFIVFSHSKRLHGIIELRTVQTLI